MAEKFPDRIVFGNYERPLITKWMNELKYFTFARGGLNEFVKDGDEFVVTFRHSGKDDLLRKLSSIGVELRAIKENEKIFRPELPIGKKNSVDLPDPIPSFPDLAQPKWKMIAEAECFIFVAEEYFWIAVSNTIGSGEWWKVFPEDFEACKRIEEIFDKVSLRDSRIYETENYGRFINRHNYPQYFTN